MARAGRGLDLEGRVIEVCRLASLAKQHFEVWRVYSAPDSRKRLWGVFDAYASFMLLDEHAHHELAILYAATLFETKHTTVHLQDLIGQIKARGIALEAVHEAENAVVASAAVAEKARFLRNNAIGHRTASMSRADVFKRAQITADELGELVHQAETIATSLAKALGHSPLILALDAASTLDKLFTDAGMFRLGSCGS